MAEARAAATAGRGGPDRRWLRRLGIVAAVALALVAAGNAYLIVTTRPNLLAGVAEAPVRPAAIVLGNKVNPDGVPSPGLVDRLELALDLYRAGRVPRLIVSGASRPEDGYDEPGAMASWLVDHGVPPGRITLDRRGHRTAATMANVAAMGVREALICTQAYHLPRALYLARHAGIDARGVPTRGGRGSLRESVRTLVREALARVETIVEVALFGVRAL